MPACKACGAWFVKVKPHEELCDKCECALYRLSGYVARVTRCKDCYQSVVIGNVLHCTYWGKDTDENGYCHEGG